MATPSWLDPTVAAPADARVLLAAVVTGVLTDIAVRAGIDTASGAALVAFVAVAMIASGRLSNPQARATAALVPLFAIWLFLRTSPWLLLPDLMVIAGLVALSASYATRGSLLDVTIPQAAARGVAAVVHGAAGLPFALSPLRSIAERATRGEGARAGWRSATVGVLLATPLVVVLGVLLASADVVFAQMFRIHVDGGLVASHVVPIVVGVAVMGGVLRTASGRIGSLPAPRTWLRATETIIVLGALTALFAAFAIAQVVALSGAGRRIIQTAGLTYAEYARSGFFQLLGVAAMTLAVLMTLRAVTNLDQERARRSFVALSTAAIALTLVIVAVSIRRIDLYEDVYGLTMLRLYTKIFALWIGAVFVLLALWLWGVGRGRHWLPSIAVTAGLAGLLALNVANPEAIVARHNLERAAAGQRFDAGYVVRLSPDALPAIVAALPRLDASLRERVLAGVCGPSSGPEEGWTEFNLAERRADAAANSVCQVPPPAKR